MLPGTLEGSRQGGCTRGFAHDSSIAEGRSWAAPRPLPARGARFWAGVEAQPAPALGTRAPRSRGQALGSLLPPFRLIPYSKMGEKGAGRRGQLRALDAPVCQPPLIPLESHFIFLLSLFMWRRVRPWISK